MSLQFKMFSNDFMIAVEYSSIVQPRMCLKVSF